MDPNNTIFDRVRGSMMGLALGDALGASVEFRPHSYLLDNPVKDLQSGGTWGLAKGQVRCLVSYRFTLNSTPSSSLTIPPWLCVWLVR